MLNSTQRGDASDAWLVTHEALASFAKKRAGLDFEEGCLLRAARQAEVHRQLGYGSFAEYVERLFGYAPRVTHDKLRVADALERLPALSRQLREGTVSFRRPEPPKTYRRRYGARCCGAIGIAAAFPAARTRSSWTFITLKRGLMAVTTTKITCSRYAARTTARLTRGRSSSP